MSDSQKLNSKYLARAPGEAGNAVVIVLVVLVIAAVGGLAFLSGKNAKDTDSKGAEVAQVADDASDTKAADAAPALVIEEGNPVVAKVHGQDVTRLDVFNLIQTLPPNTRQLPVQQLFPLAVDQLISARIIEKKTKKVNLDKDPEVKAQLEAAKQNIVRTVFIQKEVEKKITEERLKKAYEGYKANFPEIPEARASHILVDDEKLAKDLIKQLDDGGDFAELAKANSKDGTAANGGDLGFFSKTDVVPEFAEAAFALAKDAYTKKPVKSEFGYHVIKLSETRNRPAAEYEQAKPFLQTQLRQGALNELISEWQKEAGVERFDINGKPIAADDAAAKEPAAGTEKAAE